MSGIGFYDRCLLRLLSIGREAVSEQQGTDHVKNWRENFPCSLNVK